MIHLSFMQVQIMRLWSKYDILVLWLGVIGPWSFIMYLFFQKTISEKILLLKIMYITWSSYLQVK